MMVLVHFGPNLPQGNRKCYQKPTFSQKLHSYTYQITQVPGPLKWTFKVKNRPVNNDHEVRGQVSTTFSKFFNLGLSDDEKIFVVAQSKLVLFQF